MIISTRERLQTSLSENADQIRELERQYDELVAAANDTNADEEHDPEGATIAFERQQLVAVLEQSHRTRDDIVHALALLDEGAYGVCEQCGRPIGAERLEARPNARTCIVCASRRG